MQTPNHPLLHDFTEVEELAADGDICGEEAILRGNVHRNVAQAGFLRHSRPKREDAHHAVLLGPVLLHHLQALAQIHQATALGVHDSARASKRENLLPHGVVLFQPGCKVLGVAASKVQGLNVLGQLRVVQRRKVHKLCPVLAKQEKVVVVVEAEGLVKRDADPSNRLGEHAGVHIAVLHLWEPRISRYSEQLVWIQEVLCDQLQASRVLALAGVLETQVPLGKLHAFPAGNRSENCGRGAYGLLEPLDVRAVSVQSVYIFPRGLLHVHPVDPAHVDFIQNRGDKLHVLVENLEPPQLRSRRSCHRRALQHQHDRSPKPLCYLRGASDLALPVPPVIQTHATLHYCYNWLLPRLVIVLCSQGTVEGINALLFPAKQPPIQVYARP
mmetsp:Transcript_9518/g.17827  ORF Transcript_9518/g.17827 Transcript_9518/m.17827 type:complete len:385 (+) Transcript_9518:1827-2981(+)